MALYDVVLARRIQASSGAPTITELGPLRPTGLTWRQELNAPGLVTVDTVVDAVDSSLTAALQDLSATPCELHVWRDATLVHAGPVTNYQVHDRTLTLNSPGLRAYLGYMTRTTAYTPAATDQATIVKTLIDNYQAQTSGHFGLDTSTLVATGVTRQPAYQATDLIVLEQAINDLGALSGGFDLEVDPFSRQVLMYSPRKGSDFSASLILDARVINDSTYSQTVDPGSFITQAAGFSLDASGNPTLRTESSSALSSFGLAIGGSGRQDNPTNTTVDAANHRLVTDEGAPLHAVAPTLRVAVDFLFTEFGTGDVITYDYDAGLGRQSFPVRVKAITMTLNGGDELYALEFV